jgi:cyclopropane-fatty-acyl-phospholipid synthase
LYWWPQDLSCRLVQRPMNSLTRYFLAISESVVFGPSYGAVQALIRHPQPLEPDFVWDRVTNDLPPLLDWLRLQWPPAFARRPLLSLKLKQDHLLGISEHYDVSNEFYGLFLDKKYMFYSAADFNSGEESLEEAQANKADFLLRLIDPLPQDQILDLGCGWGAMMRRIIEETGNRENLVGYTLSKNQFDYIRQHDAGNVELKNFITCDYPNEKFDKIYSIGAWEHVRERDVPIVLDKLHRALKPGGRLVNQFFTGIIETPASSVVAAQIFFPGSMPAAYPSQIRAFERAGFRIGHRSIHDYRPTLRAWFDNLVANRQRAIELVGVRTYNKYLVFFPAFTRMFDDGIVILARYVLEKC